MVIRSDDFDFRLPASQYIAVHEKFVEADLVETAVLQFTQDGRLSYFDPELIKYMNEASCWDFQIHGWEHTKYNEMQPDTIVRDIGAAMFFCEKLFNKKPTVWYPPWNIWSGTMETAAKTLGLTIDNESYDIAKFIRNVEAKTYDGHSVYFHSWKPDEMLLFDRMLECAKEINAKI